MSELTRFVSNEYSSSARYSAAYLVRLSYALVLSAFVVVGCKTVQTDSASNVSVRAVHLEILKAESNRDAGAEAIQIGLSHHCLLYTSPSPRDVEESRMPSSA